MADGANLPMYINLTRGNAAHKASLKRLRAGRVHDGGPLRRLQAGRGLRLLLRS
jgi:hypothetical protein